MEDKATPSKTIDQISLLTDLNDNIKQMIKLLEEIKEATFKSVAIQEDRLMDKAMVEPEPCAEEPCEPEYPYPDKDLPELIEKASEGKQAIDELTSELEYELLTPIEVTIHLKNKNKHTLKGFKELSTFDQHARCNKCMIHIPDIKENEFIKRYIAKYVTDFEESYIGLNQIDCNDIEYNDSYHCTIAKPLYDKHLCTLYGRDKVTADPSSPPDEDASIDDLEDLYPTSKSIAPFSGATKLKSY